MRIVVLGLSVTSSWGNGHATTYRALLSELSRRGHEILFLERDQYWYADNRDLPKPSFCEVAVYRGVAELKRNFAQDVRHADAVIVGSYVPAGRDIGDWVIRTANGVTAFYDIDTPVTLRQLASNKCPYLSRATIPKFDLYLSFTGGSTLSTLERAYGARRARALYCSVDVDTYSPERCRKKWTLGYLGTFSDDRQPALQRLLIEVATAMPAASFIVAGPQYPRSIRWPANVNRIEHLEPAAHRIFYNAQRFTLNLTRAEMVRAGYSPSVRLFEAAACGTPIISDRWPGLTEFFEPGREILIAETTREMIQLLRDLPETEARAIGRRGRERILSEHTAIHRAAELERLIESVQEEDFAGTTATELEGAAS